MTLTNAEARTVSGIAERFFNSQEFSVSREESRIFFNTRDNVEHKAIVLKDKLSDYGFDTSLSYEEEDEDYKPVITVE